MRGNYNRLLKITVGVEGGISDRPLSADPGGLTNKGVTQTIYDRWRLAKGLDPRSVRQLTVAEYTELYRTEFWDKVHGDQLPAGVDLVIFDYAVNSGQVQAIKDLQRTLGLALVDGLYGNATDLSVNGADPAHVVNGVCDRRLRFMRRLKNWGPNRNGWTTRVAHVRAVGLSMALGAAAPRVATLKMSAEASGKAVPSKEAALKTADGQGLTSTTVGGVGQAAMDQAQVVQPHITDSPWGRLAMAVFILLTVVGIGLLAYGQLKRVRDKGGLGGYLSGLINT